MSIIQAELKKPRGSEDAVAGHGVDPAKVLRLRELLSANLGEANENKLASDDEYEEDNLR